jgi:hypothetical protein
MPFGSNYGMRFNLSEFSAYLLFQKNAIELPHALNKEAFLQINHRNLP